MTVHWLSPLPMYKLLFCLQLTKIPELFFKTPNTRKQLHYKGMGFLKSHKIVIKYQVMTKNIRLQKTMKQVN